MAADLPFEIAANDRMQSPHEADRWLQAFHKEGLPLAKFSGVPDIVTEMAADPSFLLLDNGKICGNCRRCCRHGHMPQDCDDLPSAEDFLARNASAVTLRTEVIIPRPDVVGDSYWPAD